MATLKFVLTWIRRIPALFTATFVVLMVAYLAAVSVFLTPDSIKALASALLSLIGFRAYDKLLPIAQTGTDGVVVVVLLASGALVMYNIAAFFYRRMRRRPAPVRIALAEPTRGEGTRLSGFDRIGIVLAGGGAKGAYQAGAMRAIYEFLEQNNALDRVVMVSGTSIGSWNAMFWLAGLVKPPAAEQQSAHEAWWRAINLTRTVEFDSYWPFRANHFVKATPWMETFDDIFIKDDRVRANLARLFDGSAAPHFYFTRSNVGRGVLEFSTNNAELARREKTDLRTGDKVPAIRPELYELIGGGVDAALRSMRDAVFTSMDLPPLFPYMYREHGFGHYYEDGGVVDNLPVWFATQIEKCDLVFILPLNASFEEPVNQSSVVHRLFRVMDVRQGVLERNSLKLAYLYNELAALRAETKRASVQKAAVAREVAAAHLAAMVDLPELSALVSEAAALTEADEDLRTPNADAPVLASRALMRDHKPVSVFAICPQQPLAINTSEFWKPREAAEAFELMYAATQGELATQFKASTDPKWLRMTLVAPQGQRAYVDDF